MATDPVAFRMSTLRMPTSQQHGHNAAPVESETAVSSRPSQIRHVTDFRSHKLWCAAESAGCLSIVHVFLAETVVRYLDMSIQCKENVVELQIAAGPQSESDGTPHK